MGVGERGWGTIHAHYDCVNIVIVTSNTYLLGSSDVITLTLCHLSNSD